MNDQQAQSDEQLTDEELRVRVCIARGDIKNHGRGWYQVNFRDNAGSRRMSRSGKVRLKDAAAMTSPSYHNNNPDYTRDMNAAWELVEEMGSQFYDLERHIAGGWSVDYYGAPDLRQRASTPQRAICEAYIAWKESA